MRRALACLALLLAAAGSVQAHGLLIPAEKTVPPLAMLQHHVSIQIDEQVTVTTVEQTFRNHTSRPLEATYVFPVPRGASVDKFTMWIDGKETHGELVEAKKAREIYNGIVRRTQDPGLLEYVGNDLLQMKVFPVPANGDQKVKLSYTAVANREGGVVEYIYPLKTDGKATATLESFRIHASLKSQHGITNVYSPTHALTVKRISDHEVAVDFDRNQGLLDKDFQMFYDLGDKDVGLTALSHRPISTEAGYFTLLISPKVEIPKDYQVPRDVVMVLDTSGSMRGVKMEQARNALKYCLKNLDGRDRFALINFATTVNQYRDNLLDANPEQIARATKWVEGLQATGGTAINDALIAAQAYRSKDEGRNFTIIFFTDGQPTIGETNVEKIVKNTLERATANTRIFTFGVGDDVNATMLDKLAEDTRAVSTYVRPAEDIEAKVSGLYAKISNPVLTNLKLTTTNGIELQEVYPPRLPDLFHGGQLIVMGRFNGKGPAAIKLTGMVGMEQKEFVYEYTFPDKTDDKREFVEALWARRKVGFLLDQIRANGEKKELVDEVTSLAKKYGITTPYTSWLIVPDAAVPVVQRVPGQGGEDRLHLAVPAPPRALAAPTGGPEAKPVPVEQFARQNQAQPGALPANRGAYAERDLKDDARGGGGFNYGPADGAAKKETQEKLQAYQQAARALARKDKEGVQTGKLGVDLSINVANLRNQTRLEQTALRNVQGRNCVEIGGVWIDEGYTPTTRAVTVKAQSDAYFKILAKQPQVRDVFRLGNHVVWITPSGTALIIDGNYGKEDLDDKEIDALFATK